jgi:hypothetical protein
MNQASENRTPGFTNSEQNHQRSENETAQNKLGIENHIRAAEHFAAASKFHYEAARYHDEGDHTKASEAAVCAMGHVSLGIECQQIDTQQHAAEAHQ